MKKQLQKITATICVALISKVAIGQINPTAKTLPFYEDFGVTTFTALPAGFASGMVSSAPLATQTAAQSSAATAAATLATATGVQTNGGSYGYSTLGDAKMYIQHSASTSTGTNQLILAINTVNWHNILVNYGVEMINANPRTAGLVLQYRVGTTGSWTNVSGGVYSHNSSDRANGAVDNFTNLSLPTAADNQPVVQLRWASWRGTQTGNSSGVAVDNVSISASPQGLNTNVSVSSVGNCGELFISEYLHETVANRAIEIYNPTSASKSLTGYYLTITTGTNTATYIPLSGTIQGGKTWVVANAKAATALTALANQLVPNFNYSGNDVIGLVYSTNPMVADVMIDVVGDPNTTVTNGYTVTALGDTGTTQNYTLTRLMSIQRGNTEWGKAQFEWFAHPVNTYTFLGWHNSVCITASLPTATFASPTYAANIIGSNNTAFPINNVDINLTGTWSQDIYMYYDDTYTWNGAGSNAGAPNLPYSCNGGVNNLTTIGHYSYGSGPGNNYVVFPSNPSNSTVSELIIITLDASFINPAMCTHTPPLTNIYLCFGVDKDPSGAQYSLGNQDVTTINIQGGCSSVGIEQVFDNKQIKVYPNPFNDQVTIENNSQAAITKVSICDLLGREVITLNPEQTGNITVNTQHLNNGIYFINVYNNNSDNYTIKLIKK
jgi:hypothetical protein